MKKSFQRVIATLNLFQGKQSLTIFMLAAIFALWGCDDSSSASEGNNETSAVESSSSVKDSDSTEESSSSIDKKSSGNETKDKSSSSIKDTEPVEVSSSSAKSSSGNNSSCLVSSSSFCSKEASSSSSKEISSSSEKNNNSGSSSSSKNNEFNSSSSVKQTSSSSNEIRSSSSKQNPWGTSAEWSPFNCKDFGGCLEFTDVRNNRSYKYLKFEGRDTLGKVTSIYAMVENLNIGVMVRGRKNQEDNDRIERYCYDNDTLNCHYYGGLYQWAEMMQLPSECNQKDCRDKYDATTLHHQGICPNGWRLLTYNDFYIIVNSNGNTHGVEGVRSTFGFGGYNTTGYSLVGAGIRVDGSFKDLNEAAYWFFPSENPIENYAAADDCYMGASDKTINKNVSYKSNGLSVRCVMDYSNVNE